MFSKFLEEHILFQQVESLEELATKIHEEEKDLLVFSLKPMSEKDIMAISLLLEQKLNIFMPNPVSIDLHGKLKLQLDSRFLT